MDQLPPEYDSAVRLLKVCYQSIDGDYRQRYRMDLWRQVEGKARMAANTSPSLPRFVQTFLSFPHTEIRQPAALAAVLAESDAQAVLRCFREESGVIVALMRAELEAERETAVRS